MSQKVKEITLRDIIRVGIRRWRVVLGSAACALAIGLGYAILATPYYTATVTVQPNGGESPFGALGAMAGQLGSLSSLVGVHLGNTESKEQNYLAVLASRELAIRFIDKYDLMPALFPGRWNPQLRQWKRIDPSWFARVRLDISRELARISGDQGWHPPSERPTAWRALKVFRRICIIRQDRSTGMVKVSFRLRNPKDAAIWANDYVKLANEEIRDRVTTQANLALGYLYSEAKDTSITELKTAISDLIQQRLEQIVSAKSRPDYAFQVIDAAMPPATRSSPNRLLIVVVAILLGGVGGLMYVLVEELGGLESQATREP